MIRRRTLLTTALTAGAAIGLAACSKDEKKASGPSDAGSNASDGGGVDALSGVKVSEDLGAEPTITFKAPLTVTQASAKVVVPGDGEKIAEGDTLIWNSVYADAQTGDVLQSWWKGAPATGVTVTKEAIGEAAFSFLTTATVGSRFAMTGWQRDQAGQPRALVQVADILRKVQPLRAEGQKAEVPAHLPAVTLDDKGAPSIAGPWKGEIPASTERHILVTGNGEKTRSGDYLTMQYTGWTADDAKQFDSSWERGTPFGFVQGSGYVIEGWDKHLLDLPVGSQVMLVIPAKEAYGEEKSEQMPLAGRDLLFVVDVLDAAHRKG